MNNKKPNQEGNYLDKTNIYHFFDNKKNIHKFLFIFVTNMIKLITIGKKTYSIGLGWLNLAKSYLGISDPDNESLAVRRLAICLQCEHNVKNICRGGCGCIIIAKVRSINENCPKQKW